MNFVEKYNLAIHENLFAQTNRYSTTSHTWENSEMFHVFLKYFRFSFHLFFCHGHSRFTGQHGKWEVTSLTPLYHFHLLYRHLDIFARRVLQRAHFCTQLVAGLEPGIFGFRAQVANHYTPRPLACIFRCDSCSFHG